MNKVLSILLKVASIFAALLTLASAYMYYTEVMTSDTPSADKPILIAMMVMGVGITIFLWNISVRMSWGRFLSSLGALLLLLAVVLAFMPVFQASGFLGTVNSGNIFTFKSNPTYDLFKESAIFSEAKQAYTKRIIYVILSLVGAIVSFFMSKKVKNNNQ